MASKGPTRAQREVLDNQHRAIKARLDMLLEQIDHLSRTANIHDVESQRLLVVIRVNAEICLDLLALIEAGREAIRSEE